MAATLDSLVFKRPLIGNGREMERYESRADIDCYADSSHATTVTYFAVEMAVPSAEDSAQWDVAVWDDPAAKWGEPYWVDVTADIQGVEWSRGTETPGAMQYDTGELTFRLKNHHGRYSPWSSNPFTQVAYMSAGTVCRVVTYDPTDLATVEPLNNLYDSGRWEAQFTGIITDWAESTAGAGADDVVTISAVETTAWLARAQLEPITPEGDGDTINGRLIRLNSKYPLPTQLFTSHGSSGDWPDPTLTLQATSLSQNLLAEYQELASSIDYFFRSTRQGRYVMVYKDERRDLWNRRIILSYTSGEEDRDGLAFIHIPYDADSLVVSNNDDALVSSVLVGPKGGTPTKYDTDTPTIPFTQNTPPPYAGLWRASEEPAPSEYLAGRILARGKAIQRPTFVSLTARSRASQQAIIEMELQDYVRVEMVNRDGDVVHFVGPVVTAYTHRVTPGPNGVFWTVDINLGTSSFSDWEIL
jgi:hypothetical protein